MKLLMYKVNTNKKNERAQIKLGMERVLFFAFIVTFTLMIIIQAALMNPSVRTFLSVSNEFEGTPLGVEEYLYDEGELSLELLGDESNSEIKILINGEETADFSDNNIRLTVRDGDVIEIDGSNVNDSVEVMVVSGSNNISAECINTWVKVKSNVRRLVKVKIE